MSGRSEGRGAPDDAFEKLLGLGESFSVKSHYPVFKAVERELVENEARLRAMLDAVPFDMFLTDGAGEVLLRNGALRGGGAQRRAGAAGSEPGAGLSTSEAVRRDFGQGQARWFLEIRRPVLVSGAQSGTVGVDIDVTEQKLAEEALLEAKEKLERQVRARTEMLRQANQELQLKRLSLERALSELRAAQESLVKSRYHASVGRVLAAIAHELNSPLASIESAAGHLASTREEARVAIAGLRSLDGPLVAAVDALLAKSVEPVYIGSDERRKLAETLAAAGCERYIDVADDLCDLGCPDPDDETLKTIIGPGGSEAVGMAWVLGSMFGSASLVSRAARKAADVVKSLDAYLELAEPAESTLRDFDLASRLSRFNESIDPGYRRIGLELESELSAFGDPERLDLVWDNLVDNALYASGPSGRVTVRASREGSGALVEVEDDGPGVAPEIAGRLFDPLFSTKGIEEGKGLGLDICRTIVDTHGGTIWFDSAPGRTVFSVRLPGPNDGVFKKP